MYKYLSILTLFFFSCSTQAPLISEQNSSLIRQHKKVAILPFQVNFNEDFRLQKAYRSGQRDYSDEYWVEQGRLAGLELQKSFFLSLVKQVEKGKTLIVVQDFLQTRKILESNNIGFFDLQDSDKGQLAQILEVDAVFYGETDVNSSIRNYGFNDGVETVVDLYDRRTGDKIWEITETQRPNSGFDSPSRLGNMIVSSISKRQPYQNL